MKIIIIIELNACANRWSTVRARIHGDMKCRSPGLPVVQTGSTVPLLHNHWVTQCLAMQR
jgi:hypothetical protein